MATRFHRVHSLLVLTVLAATGPLGPVRREASAQIVRLPRPPGQYVGNFSDGLAGLLDVDGDGDGDLVVGAGGAFDLPPVLEQRGRAYLYSGAHAGFLRVTEPPLGLPPPDSEFGRHVIGLGDLDGDGRGDFAVSSHLETHSGGPSFAGRVYVFSGATGMLLRPVRSPMEQAGSNFGLCLAAVPDCDGDGRTDIAAGSTEEGIFGRLHVLSGATGEWLRTLVSPNPNQRSSSFGVNVAGVSDITGDGLGDVMVSTNERLAPPYSGIGNVYVFSGATGEVVYTLYSPVQPSQNFGNGGVGGVPDTDGDGWPDLVVGSGGERRPGDPLYAGLVHLFSGATGELLRTLASPAPVPGGAFGIEVAGVEDADADGRGDLLVGASGEAQNTGIVYLLSGADGRVLRSLRSPYPETAGFFGDKLATVPDANGDGRAEWLIGAPGEEWGGAYGTGHAYLVYSCAADFDASGVLTAADFFAFLDAFLEQRPSADFDRSGTLDSNDFFAYIVAFFAGCPT